VAKPVALITGASGFVGGALARSLSTTHKVVAIVRDGAPPTNCVVVRGELEDLRVCERAIVDHRPDVVYHLAAQAIVGHAKQDPWATFEANVRGTYNLMEACRRHSNKPGQVVPIVVASSDKAYGDLPYGQEYHESTPLRGAGYYDCSKSCTDMIAECYGRNTIMPVVIIRAGNIYGPGDTDMSRVVPSLVDDAINRRGLNILSDGSPVRDYLYIDDAVEAYKLAAAYAATSCHVPRAFNISGGEPVSVLELAQKIQKQYSRFERPAPTIRIHKSSERYGEISYQVLDTARAREELRFTPSVSLDDGLYNTILAAKGDR
jgi:CDP-glucose 4,6-dehydratase